MAEAKTKKAAPKTAAPKTKEVKEEKAVATVKVVNRLETKYKNEVVPALVKKFNYKSVMQAPKLNKIVINMGVGDATGNAKLLEDAVRELTLIAGQKPVITKAKKSEASFKLREGQEIGCKVTLRGVKMYDFLDKLVTISLPRVRDFRGVSRNAFDGHGNYTLGVKEQLIFAEIDFDQVNKVRGMDVVIVTTAQTDEEAQALLAELGMPFAR
ncbi:MAG: 50S ribosomal protein L5 [Bacilli bacterium]